MGWEKSTLEDDCVYVSAPDRSIRFLCQREDGYVPPVWPQAPGAQQKIAHMDFTVSDMERAVAHALSLGASVAKEQYHPAQWTTMLDPAGHPFCLCLPE